MKLIASLLLAASVLATPPGLAEARVAAWLGTASGLPVTHIPYKGGASLLTDVVGGQIEVGVISNALMMGPKELGEFQLREYQRFKRVADLAGIKAE